MTALSSAGRSPLIYRCCVWQPSQNFLHIDIRFLMADPETGSWLSCARWKAPGAGGAHFCLGFPLQWQTHSPGEARGSCWPGQHSEGLEKSGGCFGPWASLLVVSSAWLPQTRTQEASFLPLELTPWDTFSASSALVPTPSLSKPSCSAGFFFFLLPSILMT